jgi:hypothetical protein
MRLQFRRCVAYGGENVGEGKKLDGGSIVTVLTAQPG